MTSDERSAVLTVVDFLMASASALERIESSIAPPLAAAIVSRVCGELQVWADWIELDLCDPDPAPDDDGGDDDGEPLPKPAPVAEAA